MDINRLNEFIVLATHLNYSKSANQLFLTQPALSRHIHDLEQTVGAQLLLRDTHNVHLTPAGETFLEEAQAIIGRYNHALSLMQEITSATTGELRIGFLSHAAQPFLTQFVPYFNHLHPHIHLKLVCNDLDRLTRMLNENEIDFAFVTHVDSSMFSGLASNTILVDRLYAAMSPKNPLAKKEYLYLKDFASQNMIAYSKATHPLTYDYHLHLFKKAGVPFNISQEIDSPESGIFYASINAGIYLMPAHLNVLAKGLITIPVMDDSCTIPLNLLWKKNNTNPSMPIFHKEFASFLLNETDKSISFYV